MLGIAIRLVAYHIGNGVDVLARDGVKVYDAHLATGDLIKPDGCVVAETQVPTRIHRQVGIVWHAGDAALILRFAHLLSKKSTEDRSLKAALVLL